MYKALIAGSVAAATLVSYCVYFDHKRRSAPHYKQKLREKRRAQRLASQNEEMDIPTPSGMDQMSVQKFFFEQIQTGEEKLGMGDIKGSIKHFIAAVLHSAQGYQLLQVLQSTMPPEAYKMLMEALPKAQAKITQARLAKMGGNVPKSAPSKSTERVIAEEAID